MTYSVKLPFYWVVDYGVRRRFGPTASKATADNLLKKVRTHFCSDLFLEVATNVGVTREADLTEEMRNLPATSAQDFAKEIKKGRKPV